MSLNPFKQHSVQDVVKDVYIKKALAERTVRIVRDVQMEAMQSKQRHLGPGDIVNCFCELVEAIFLHGLKSRLGRIMFSELFGGGPMSARSFTSTSSSSFPRPDFWPLVRIVTHRVGLTTINELDQITTDVGRCRAWIRLAINDETLTSSIECITGDSKSLSCFYRSSALLRDNELIPIIIKLLSTLSNVHFVLPLNVASLNFWQPGPLVLCGMWKNQEHSEDLSPVIRGVDVDDYFIKNDNGSCGEPDKQLVPPTSNKCEQHEAPYLEVSLSPFVVRQRETHLADALGLPVSIAEEIQQALKCSGGKRDETPRPETSDCELEKKEVQQLILDLKLDSNQGFTQVVENDVAGLPNKTFEVHENFLTQPIKEVRSGPETIRSWSYGQLTECGGGWSSAFAESPSTGATMSCCERSPSEGDLSISKEITDESSFDSILNACTRDVRSSPLVDILPVDTPQILEATKTATLDERNSETAPETESENSDEEDFEIINVPVKEDSRTLALLESFGKISRERGLDQQNFECAGCKCSIGMIFGPYKKCSLDGYLYCTECMGQDTKIEEHVIPARIVHDWDLRVHPVCSYNKRFLLRYEHEPLLNLRELNPVLYSVVPELAAVQMLRRQLGFLRLYVFSCQVSSREEFKKLLWPREHLYEHIHLYSILDLLSVPSGCLQKTLEKAVQFARKHVSSCQLCCQRGFICELCNNPKIIFPFNLDETFFCERCSALYHKKCIAEKGQSCVKCERKREREQRLKLERLFDEE